MKRRQLLLFWSWGLLTLTLLAGLPFAYFEGYTAGQMIEIQGRKRVEIDWIEEVLNNKPEYSGIVVQNIYGRSLFLTGSVESKVLQSLKSEFAAAIGTPITEVLLGDVKIVEDIEEK